MRDGSLGLGGWGLRFRPQGSEFRLGGSGFAGFLGCIVLTEYIGLIGFIGLVGVRGLLGLMGFRTLSFGVWY